MIKTILGGTPDGIPARSASLNTPSAVAVDASGNIFVALNTAHSVIKIDPNGIATIVAGSGGSGNSGDDGPAREATLNSPTGLAVDSAGNLYIADPSNNRVRVVGRDGLIHAFAGSGKSGNSGDEGRATTAQLSSPAAITFDSSGNALIADTGNAEIRMVTPDGIIHLFAGTGSSGYDGDTGTALSAQFSSPSGLAVDAAGNVYVADTRNQRIRMIAPDGSTSVIAGKGVAAYFGDGRAATSAYLNNPTALASDRAGNLYIADIGNDRVRRITTDGKISSYAGTGNHGAEGDGGWATSANLNLLGIAIDANNNLLIADGTNYRVRIVTAADGIIDTLAGAGLVSYNPRGIVVNGNTVIFSDGDNNRVRQFDLVSGQTNIVAGTGKADFSGDGSAAASAAINAPRGLFLDSTGNLYIADSKNNRIRQVAPDGTISTVAGNGSTDGGGDLGPATQASLNEPIDVAKDGSGNLYILERTGQRLRRVGPDGTISTIAGTGSYGQPDAETGVATSEPLNFAQGLALDASGNVLIGDSSNNRVRRVSSDGVITTVAGSAVGGFRGDGGSATAASLRGPAGVAVDTGGNVIIADSTNNVVRRIDTNGNIATIAGTPVSTGTPPSGYNGDGSPATQYRLNRPMGIAIGPGCSVLISDMLNQRIRQLWPAGDYTITSTASGLQVLVDGQVFATPLIVSWLPGTSHQIDAQPQSGSAGTQYVSAGSQSVSVPCGAAAASLTQSLITQYFLTVNAGDGGTVSVSTGWQNSGTTLTLTANPNQGSAFAGWGGDCSGSDICTVTMNQPRTVSATFTQGQSSNRRYPVPRHF